MQDSQGQEVRAEHGQVLLRLRRQSEAKMQGESRVVIVTAAPDELRCVRFPFLLLL